MVRQLEKLLGEKLALRAVDGLTLAQPEKLKDAPKGKLKVGSRHKPQRRKRNFSRARHNNNHREAA